MVTAPEARNGYTELYWCMWHLHRASNAILNCHLRFASSVVSHFPHTRDLSIFHVFLSAFHTICGIFLQIVEEQKCVVEI
jgi:hypothetical protein